MEDKQAICDALAKTLRLTREYYDVDSIEYEETDKPDLEFVHVWWTGDDGRYYDQKINVSLDSGAAMIRDILYAIR